MVGRTLQIGGFNTNFNLQTKGGELEEHYKLGKLTPRFSINLEPFTVVKTLQIKII